MSRNGGHITPVLYQEYCELKKEYGPQVAAQIIRFRLSHLAELLSIAAEEGLLEDSQCRETESYDVYQDTTLYHHAKQLLQVYTEDLPVEGSDFRIIEDKETLAVRFLLLSPIVRHDGGFLFCRNFNLRPPLWAVLPRGVAQCIPIVL